MAGDSFWFFHDPWFDPCAVRTFSVSEYVDVAGLLLGPCLWYACSSLSGLHAALSPLRSWLVYEDNGSVAPGVQGRIVPLRDNGWLSWSRIS